MWTLEGFVHTTLSGFEPRSPSSTLLGVTAVPETVLSSGSCLFASFPTSNFLRRGWGEGGGGESPCSRCVCVWNSFLSQVSWTHYIVRGQVVRAGCVSKAGIHPPEILS